MIDSEDLIEDVDLTRRSDEEWQKIYHVQIMDGEIDVSPINEFEFAYKLVHSKYCPKPSLNKGEMDYSIPEQMEMRAMKINRDIYTNADKFEKSQLDNRYFATKYILNYSVK